MRRVTLPMAIVFPYLLLACSGGDLLESAGPYLEACSTVKSQHYSVPDVIGFASSLIVSKVSHGAAQQSSKARKWAT